VAGPALALGCARPGRTRAVLLKNLLGPRSARSSTACTRALLLGGGGGGGGEVGRHTGGGSSDWECARWSRGVPTVGWQIEGICMGGQGWGLDHKLGGRAYWAPAGRWWG